MRHWRSNLILLFIILFGAAIIGRLVFLQILRRDFYAALANAQQQFFSKTFGDRGEIFLQNHDFPIAVNKTNTLVYVSPNEIFLENKEVTAEILSEVLDLNKDFLLEKLKKDSLYELIKNRVSDREIEKLKEIDLAGVYFKQTKIRDYPYENFASSLLGFVNMDGQGQYGAEERWNDLLMGREEFLVGKRGPLGHLFFGDRERLNTRGSNIILTIDYNIQYLAEKLLEKAYAQWEIDGGQIIVIDPHSGQILALADFPAFNPNRYFEEQNFKIFKNDVVQKIFEPGSVFKPITMAIALNARKITPDTTYIDPGVIKIGGWSIRNYDQRVYPGEITMIEVLEKSINTGIVFVQRKLQRDLFVKYLEKFGLFELTEIDLPGEIFSQNLELKNGSEINFATASYGQGISVTPIQLVRAFSVIANGGKLIRPHVVEKIKNSDNTIIETEMSSDLREVISSRTASKLTAMLVSTVEHPFTRRAQIPGYYVAGKTGTAQVSWAALGYDRIGYSDQLVHTFVGFAPAFNPRFLILVKLDNPKGVRTASLSAAPIFQELAKYIINYYQIPPDY